MFDVDFSEWLSSIHFEWIRVLWLAPLPLLVLLLPAAASSQQAALKLPNAEALTPWLGRAGKKNNRWWRQLLALLAWLCLVVAAARPQWIGEPIELPASGRDLMLAVDISGSMEEQDSKIRGRSVSRLQAVQ
ncbi:MAG: BatB protein, partial [Gammaproteobacteria bacterium]|nr:BatB protein [Gammaproteobacteria bacterium]